MKKRLLASDSIHFPTLEKLKNACPPETWPIIRNELFSALKYHKNVDRFYAAEGCYDLLWDYVKSTDRLIMVDHAGNIVDGDELLYIIALARQARGELSGPVIGTLRSRRSSIAGAP